MSKIKLTELSRVMSHALRHEPWLYELELDTEGWVPIKLLMSSIRYCNSEWSELNQIHIEQVVNQADKKRHEIKGDKIRAIYGHTVPNLLKKTPAPPPAILYHGTAPETVEEIKASGLKPMSRNYVHLGLTEDIANQVGMRKSKHPVILAVDAKSASENGIQFYEGNEQVWLSDDIPAEFIRFPS